MTGTPVTKRQIEQIRELRSRGTLQKNIAIRLGLHRKTVEKVLQEKKHDMRPSAGGPALPQ
jgi:DNA invertase Pin-like site-specific DNA recombinase